jgi:hypothetical protein
MNTTFGSAGTIAVGLIAGAALTLAPLAFAQGDKVKNFSLWPGKKGVEVQIQESGRTLVRGATVTAISGSTITASVVLGGTTLAWTAVTDGSTKFLDKNGRTGASNTVAVGNTISFSGSLTNASGLSVKVDTVKNWSKDSATSSKHTFEGTLQSIASTTAPTSFVLKVGNTNYTVNVATTALVLQNNWTRGTLSQLAIGHTVRVYGSVQANNASVIDALIVRDTSLK